MLIGPYINGAAIVIGGMVGAFLGTKMPARVRDALPQTFGLASMGLGITLIIKVEYMPAVVLAMILGAMLGELVYIEKGINKLAGKTRGVVDKIFPTNGGLPHQEFIEKFVAILILFCASGTGVFGAMQEGISGDPSILYIKAILDLFTAAIFAATLGFSIMTIAVPQVLIQVSLAMLALLILPVVTPSMMGDFSAAGGFIMLATGLRICGIKTFPIANMLPALLLVMPFSYIWSTFIQ